jgi:hypothetical protein
MLNTFRDMMSLAEVLMVNTVIDKECYSSVVACVGNLISKWQETWLMVRKWLIETELDSTQTVLEFLDRVPCSEKVKAVVRLSLDVHAEFWQQVFYNLKACQLALRNEA